MTWETKKQISEMEKAPKGQTPLLLLIEPTTLLKHICQISSRWINEWINIRGQHSTEEVSP